jgi:hypothetical protein
MAFTISLKVKTLMFSQNIFNKRPSNEGTPQTDRAQAHRSATHHERTYGHAD